MARRKTALILLAAITPAALFCFASSPQAKPGPPFIREEGSATDPAVALAKMQRYAAFEKASSELALERTRNERVRGLAQNLLQHARILEGALEAVSREGATVPETDLSAGERQSLEQLRQLGEPNFDARYLAAMSGAYEQWRQDLKGFEVHGADGPVKDLVEAAQPRA